MAPSPQTPLPPGPGHRSGPNSHFLSVIVIVIVIVILVCLCTFTFAQVKLSDITEIPSSAVGRFSNAIPPKVLMGLAHVPNLADVDPNDWTYVREHLEGVWMNLSLTGTDDAKKILTSLKTRDYYFIAGVCFAEHGKNLPAQRGCFAGLHENHAGRRPCPCL